MGFMGYLIMTTTPIEAKLWNPYDILGIADVRAAPDTATTATVSQKYKELLTISLVIHGKANQVTLQAPVSQISS